MSLLKAKDILDYSLVPLYYLGVAVGFIGRPFISGCREGNQIKLYEGIADEYDEVSRKYESILSTPVEENTNENPSQS